MSRPLHTSLYGCKASQITLLRFLLALLLLPWAAFAQIDYKVYTDHPRLFLHSGRRQRLQRDMKRGSDRWITLQYLIENQKPLPEEPLVQALQYQVVSDKEAARQAIRWALEKATGAFGKPDDLRLGSIVFDWCYPMLNNTQRTTLAAALGEAAKKITTQPTPGMQAMRSALLAALSIVDDWPHPEEIIADIFERHWESRLLLVVQNGGVLDRSGDLFALLEMMHASRRNLELDVWRQARDFFRSLPTVLMLSSYPQPIQTSEGVFHRAARKTGAETDNAAEAGTLRIAEMLLIDYANGLADYQYLQGWLRHDAFTLTTPYGAVYEFIWLNPYRPGLSYFSAPRVVHDKARGHLFARQSWHEKALWVGYLDGEFQLFDSGRLHVVTKDDHAAPLIFPHTAIILDTVPMDFTVEVPNGKAIYILGLAEDKIYHVQINTEPPELFMAGRGGILTLENRPESSKLQIDFDAPVQVHIRSTL